MKQCQDLMIAALSGDVLGRGTRWIDDPGDALLAVCMKLNPGMRARTQEQRDNLRRIAPHRTVERRLAVMRTTDIRIGTVGKQ